MKLSIENLIRGLCEPPSYEEHVAFSAHATTSDYSDEVGFHVYARIRPSLRLYAPDNGGDANRFYRVIHAFTKISAECAAQFGGQLLEAQGVMTHFIFTEELNTPETQNRIIEFANVLCAAVDEVVKPLCAESWNGFAVCADHGRALMVTGRVDSIVSLGPCANHPAKRIYQRDEKSGVPSGQIHIRNESGTWRMENMTPISTIINLNAKQRDFVSLASRLYEESSLNIPQVRSLGSDDVPEFLANQIDVPVTIQAHMVRADMHNFTKRVANAFQSGSERDIQNLANEFRQLMSKADAAISSFSSPTHKLPWAGDCANFVILPAEGGYDEDRADVSANIGGHWHDTMSFNKGSANEVSWTVGCAGGGSENEANGMLLIGIVGVGERNFEIIAGWGSTHSQRAQEISDAKEFDTVIPDCDYQELLSVLQPNFQSCQQAFDGHRYYRSHGLSVKKVKNSYLVGTSMQTVSVCEPVSRPYVKHYADGRK